MYRTCLGLLALGLLAGCGGGGPPKQVGPPPARVKLLTLQPQPVEESAEYLAEINSRRSVTLRAQVAGYVRAVYVKAGDRLTQGSPIIQIDPSREQATLANLEAARNARRAALQNAQDQYERAARLAPAGVVSQEQLIQATAALDAARADLNAAESQIRAQQAQLGYFRVEAPFAGVVSDILVKLGDLLSPGTPITVLNQSTALEADLQIPVLRATRLRPDSVIQLLDTQGGGVRAQGRVDFVSPDVSPDTQTVLVRTIFESAPGLKFAERVPARVIWGAHPGLTIPTVAVVRRSGQTFVYVAEEEGGRLLARQRTVLLGEISGNAYEVKEGLKPGERVVVSGVQKVVNGGPLQSEP